uniref:Succinate-semialdehyde dehydrogenase, mitochondrial n=1 Tax=Globisporangium ultimum (strain ATCC 200006 / CBS 805.95 / DAOM BR144) TaxID=431595 RepID=K3X4C1_GLOUD
MASTSTKTSTGIAAGFHSEVQNRDLICTQGFINGKWIDAHSKAHFSVTDPATDEEIARVADMGKEETQDAIHAALEAQRSWRKTTPLVRSNLLKKWYAAICDNADDLAVIASAESGKPLPEAKGEVAYAAGFIDYYAHEIMHSAGFVVPPGAPGQQLIAVKEPVGVCGIITPWNFPLAMITRKLGPCLAAGCTAVVKPAAETPLSALAIAKLAQDVGIPSGVINVVTSPHARAAEIGETLSTSKDVRKLSFTGSTRVGKILMQQSAENVKRLSLELGGNAPFIVFEDADVDAAVDGLVASKFRNTGQTCVCTNRVFVHSSIYQEFSDKLTAKVKNLKMGRPRSPGIQLGPLISQAAFQKTSDLVDDAVSKGAKALTGGKKSELGSNFYEATVLSDVDHTMRVSQEEIFGPIAPLFSFSSEEEVVAKANSTEAGLAGYFYTRDMSRAWRVAKELECGMIGVNTGLISNVQAPFGGVKQSGLGREGSPLGLDEYTETKLVVTAGLA